MLVLAIDTSSAAVTAGLVDVSDATALARAERSELNARGHGEYLAPNIAACLDDVNLRPADLGAIVAGVGPGPFTGLRVGLVTAAALADTLGIPAYGVCSLDAIAESARDEAALLVATDARRREVYWARYEHGTRVAGPDVCAPGDVSVDGVTAVAGAGGELYADAWPQLTRRDERYPAPLALVRCALDRVGAGAPSEPLAPLYLRRPDAVEPRARKSTVQ